MKYHIVTEVSDEDTLTEFDVSGHFLSHAIAVATAQECVEIRPDEVRVYVITALGKLVWDSNEVPST